MLQMLMLYLANIVAILLTVYIFELSKAITSTILGDTTPKKYGMLTLNIFKYVEPIGFLLFFFFGYGWGKPAPVSSYNYKDKKTGILITNITPIAVALIIAALLGIAGTYIPLDSGIFGFFINAIHLSMVRIAVFNLIPIPPMCGNEILKCFLSPNTAFQYGQNMAMIQMAFLFLWFFGIITPVLDNVVNVIMLVL